MISATNLTKRYGGTLAVDHLTFEVQPGLVTGFLGPNGAGKSTTMRMILGLDRADGGSVTVHRRCYQDLPAPATEVGALLDAKAIQGGRTAYRHLQWVARASGVPRKRIDEVLDLVGLRNVAGRKAGGFSLGMSQRLGIATALLGDPDVLLFDEPVNGLDPEGIRWLRGLLRDLASEGRTIFVSSHLMSEMEEIADRVIVIGRGRLIADASIEEFTERGTGSHVRVVSASDTELVPLLAHAGAIVTGDRDGALIVTGLDARRIGDLAADYRIPLYELAPRRASLEAAFMELTDESVDFRVSAAVADDTIAEAALAVAGKDSR